MPARDRRDHAVPDAGSCLRSRLPDPNDESQKALEAYQADFANDAAEIDELVGDFEDEPVPTAQEALRQLVMGERMDDRVGFVYAYCLKHLCNAHGEFLDNSAWYPAGYPHLERVQEALDVAGVPRETIAISQLTAGVAGRVESVAPDLPRPEPRSDLLLPLTSSRRRRRASRLRARAGLFGLVARGTRARCRASPTR